MNTMIKWVLAGLLIVGLGAALQYSIPSTPLDLKTSAQLPVLHGGREKPLSSVALHSLMVISGKQTLRLENRTLDAMTWLWDMMVLPRKADTYPVFRIYHPDIHTLINRTLEDGKYVSFTQLKSHLPDIETEFTKAQAVDRSTRTPYQRAMIQLYTQIRLYAQLQLTLMMPDSPVLNTHIERFESLSRWGHRLLEVSSAQFNTDEKAQVVHLIAYFKGLRQLEEEVVVRLLPPTADHEWRSFQSGVLDAMGTHSVHPTAKAYATLSEAYAQANPAQFSASLEVLLGQLAAPSFKVKLENTMNRYHPFYVLMVVYVGLFLAMFISWAKYDRLYEWVVRVLVVAGGVHTFALIARMVIQGRPPVTNLYASSVFVGWAGVLICILLEKYLRNGVAVLIATIMGFITLIIAHHLSFQGDTLEMMQAVLDSNFWLSTHVVTITLGYSAVFILGILGHIYIFKGVFTKQLTASYAKTLYQLMFGVALFAILLSAIGTILGGIWADQSWGRFWGWDPKENGALLIVIWLAIMLHARLAGMIADRGFAIMAVFANIVTSFSWFGVNMLGVGLHSYGFMDSMFKWLIGFCAIELLVMWIGGFPKRNWASFRD